jgi:O-antigen/teichoic acid export membrane protein
MSPNKIVLFSIGPVGGGVLALIFIPIVAWQFSQEDIGRIALLQVMVSFSTLFFTLGLDQAYVRDFHDEKNKPLLLKNAYLPGLILILFSLLIINLLDGNLLGLIFQSDGWRVNLFVSLAILAAFISRFLSLVLRMHERGLAYSMSELLPKLLMLIIVSGYILLETDKNFENLLFANASSLIFVCLIFLFNTRKEWFQSLSSIIDIKRIKGMMTFGMPLILAGIAYWGITATSKIFLREFSNFQELGLYAVATNFAGFALIFKSIFTTVWVPIVYKRISKGNGYNYILKINRYILAITLFLFCLVGLFSWIIIYILPSEYISVRWILVACLGPPLLYTLSETTVVGISIARRSIFSMWSSIISFVLSILLNWILIPTFGAAGAAVATCISFWIFLVLRTEFAIFLWKPIPRFLMYTYSLLAVTGASISALFGEIVYEYMLFFWLVSLIYIVFKFKKEIICLKIFLKSFNEKN